MKTTVTALLLAALLGSGAHCVAADRITIMVGGIEKQIYLPVKLAEQLGYLRETGLEVELLSVPAGGSAETEMLSGAAQGVVGFYDHTIDLQARGKQVQSVVQFSQAPGEVILVAQSAGTIKSLADFKGKTLGVTGLGSSTNFLMLYLAAKAGVRSTEFTTLPVGAGDRFIAAMGQRTIDAGMTSEPTVARMVSSGAARILVDLRSVEGTEKALGGTYPGACLYMPTAWVNTHKEQVQKLANAFVKTLRYIRRHSAKEIVEKMPPEFYGASKQVYLDALTASKDMFTDDGVMPPNGPATVLKVLNGFDRAVQGKSVNLDNTYTSEFVRAAK